MDQLRAGTGSKKFSSNVMEELRSRFPKKDPLINDNTNNNNPEQNLELQRQAWDSLWADNITPWDLGSPTPALRLELDMFMKEVRSTSTSLTYRVLVPGCGAGYDLATLAGHFNQLIQNRTNEGYHSPSNVIVVGLDVSEKSLNKASVRLQQTLSEENTNLSHTQIQLIQGDFFDFHHHQTLLHKFGKEQEEDTDFEQLYDMIFDYTFFCALPPSLRPRWGERTAQLLVPGSGRLLTLMFPIIPKTASTSQDDESSETYPTDLKGPPYPVTEHAYRKVLQLHGVHMDEESGPRKNEASVSSRSEMELACWWKKGSKHSQL